MPAPEFAQPLHLAATAQAFGEVTFHTRVLGCVERAIDVPRQQRLGLAFTTDRLSGTNAGSSCVLRLSPKEFLQLAARMNMRVFTVSTGQPTICAISRYAQPW